MTPAAMAGLGGKRAANAPSRSRFALASVAIAATIAFCGFSALGIWQLERRVWKLDLIARVEARIHAEPVVAPGPAQWSAINASDDEYRRVRLTGLFARGEDAFVQATTELGAGFWVLAPFKTSEGFTVLVNRGFIPAEKREAFGPHPNEPNDLTTVVGLMRMTEPKGAFLRSNDPANDLWRSRDVAAIAATRNIPDAAPYFVDADATPNPGGSPVGGLTVVAFRNEHLTYAITWFALAIMVVGGAAIFARHEIAARRALTRT